MQFFAKSPAGSYLAKDADDEPMLKMLAMNYTMNAAKFRDQLSPVDH